MARLADVKLWVGWAVVMLIVLALTDQLTWTYVASVAIVATAAFGICKMAKRRSQQDVG